MSDKQASDQTIAQLRTPPDDYGAWNEYWTKEHNQLWRTEPEIDEERQRYLAERRTIVPDIQRDIYPFKDIHLSRADVEWLLATHESGGMHGPVDWSEEIQRKRSGLDLRGAEVIGCNLSGLPLACLRAGAESTVGVLVPDRERRRASLSAFGAQFEDTHLEGARLTGAHLEWANLSRVHLEQATCDLAVFSGASLVGAHLEGTNLQLAYFAGWLVPQETVQELRDTLVDFPRILAPANLSQAYLDSRTLLDGVSLGDKKRGYVRVLGVHVNGANLADIDWQQMRRVGEERNGPDEGGYTFVSQEQLEAFRQSSFYKLRRDITDTQYPRIFKWIALFLIGGPLQRLLQRAFWRGVRQSEISRAIQAYQQLATVLRTQGLNVAANRFSYRAEVLKTRLLFDQSLSKYFGSQLIRLISGYGYRPLRSFTTYVVTIGLFAILYWCVTNDVSLTHGLFTQALLLLNMTPPAAPTYHLQGYEAVVVSMTSFHGRGFFQPMQSPGDKVAILSAIEAAAGLFIEIIFIATFTQRFFNR